MQPDELDHIRADIRAALPEAQYVDHSLLPDLIDHLLTAVGYVALGECRCYPSGFNPASYVQQDCPLHGEPAYWAAGILRECQIRAVSQIPFYGRDLEGDEEPTRDPDDEPHWSDHL